MGLADKLKDLVKKGQDEAATHKDQVHQAVVKAEQTADRQTGGQYHDQIVKAGEKADAYVDGLRPADGRGTGSARPPADPGRPGPHRRRRDCASPALTPVVPVLIRRAARRLRAARRSRRDGRAAAAMSSLVARLLAGLEAEHELAGGLEHPGLASRRSESPFWRRTAAPEVLRVRSARRRIARSIRDAALDHRGRRCPPGAGPRAGSAG